jgi:hypothetical protein
VENIKFNNISIKDCLQDECTSLSQCSGRDDQFHFLWNDYLNPCVDTISSNTRRSPSPHRQLHLTPQTSIPMLTMSISNPSRQTIPSLSSTCWISHPRGPIPQHSSSKSSRA